MSLPCLPKFRLSLDNRSSRQVCGVVCSQLSEEIWGCSEQFQADRLQLGGVYLLFLEVPQRWQLSGDENFVFAKNREFKRVVCASVNIDR